MDFLSQVSHHLDHASPSSLTSSQKKFTDAVNGKSGLTFFAAQESEVRPLRAPDDAVLIQDRLKARMLLKMSSQKYSATQSCEKFSSRQPEEWTS